MVVGQGGMDWEFGISRCKLLYIERINYKVLLYGTGNYQYVQYPVINHNGKEYEKEYIYIYRYYIYYLISIYIIYITESLYCTPETNTTLQTNYISILKKGSEQPPP